jgi:hypothetical protein
LKAENAELKNALEAYKNAGTAITAASEAEVRFLKHIL